MAKLRISVVEYLNTAPLVWGFTEGSLKGKYELSFTVPSLCAEALRSGQAEVAIIPAVEYQRMDDVVVLPDISIATKRDVRSILVIGKKPIEEARRIALDSSSRSSAALVRLLCGRRWRIAPEFVEAKPDPAAMLRDADAALVIGDPALRISVLMESLNSGGGATEWPVPGVESLYCYDVGEQWKAMTGRPCVLAFWAARREAATPDVVADFAASKAEGMAHLPEIAAVASAKLKLPAATLEQYLRVHIDYGLDKECQQGLSLYYGLCAEAGLIPKAKPVEFATAAAAKAK